jgi:hypothetical protein
VKGAFVRKRVKASFDPKIFLAKVGEGKTISEYRKDQIVFSQGQVDGMGRKAWKRQQLI